MAPCKLIAMKQQITTTTTTKDIRAFLNADTTKRQLGRGLPQHMDADRMVRIATTALGKTPKLAQCSQASLIECMLDCSALGIEPDGRLAHLIPYGDKCTLIVDYKGLIQLAKRSGEVKIFRAEVVKEEDVFGWQTGVVSHSVDFKKPRGKAIIYYSTVLTKDDDLDYEVMTRGEVEEIRERSKAKDVGPWRTDFDEMAKKTVIRRHAKRLTLSPEFHDALKFAGNDDDGTPLRNVTPNEPTFTPDFGLEEFNPDNENLPGEAETEPKTATSEVEGNTTEPGASVDCAPGEVASMKLKEVLAMFAGMNLTETVLLEAAKAAKLCSPKTQALDEITLPNLRKLWQLVES